ncbi:MAG: N-acetylmuramoyl-L-alanine amidase [Lentisphaeria bacterium]|nr:N-acetylmuramoyl-L-alanine amidase [Lentisphaeria bacterium]
MAIEHLIVLGIAIIIIAIGIRKARRVLKGSADGCDSGCCQSCGKNCPVKNLPNFSPQKSAPTPADTPPEPSPDNSPRHPPHLPLVALLLTTLAATLSGCISPSSPPLATRNHRSVLRNGVPVTVMLLDDNAYNRKYKLPGKMPQVTTITIHNTANDASARAERDYLNRRRDNKYISFHYAVDENGAIQIMRHDQHAWHAGDGRGNGNLKSIAIEICRSTCITHNAQLYTRAEENAVNLAAWLLKIHGLTTDDLRTHQDWSGKFCPHRILKEQRWQKFKQRVKKAMPL